jgi:hypothetical protein
MGAYTDFFIATRDDLRRAFVGWRRPLPEQEEQRTVNPFTKAPTTALRWVPDPADDHDVDPLPGHSLGDRLLAFPTVPLSDLNPLLLGALVAVALDDDAWFARFAHGSEAPPLVAPEGDEPHFLAELPEAFVKRVASWSDADLRQVAASWAQSERINWSPEECADVLGELRELAARGLRERRQLYYWM